MGGENEDGNGINMNVPPGFRFCPTDEQLIVNFLYYKSFQIPNNSNFIPDLPHLSTHDPWQLQGDLQPFCSGNEEYYWYFFSKNKETWMTQSGFWKQLDYEEPIFNNSINNKIGFKNLLGFYIGDLQTNWVMQQYHLCDDAAATTHQTTRKKRVSNGAKWVLCKVHENKGGGDSPSSYSDEDRDSNGTQLSYMDELFLSLEDEDNILLT